MPHTAFSLIMLRSNLAASTMIGIFFLQRKSKTLKARSQKTGMIKNAYIPDPEDKKPEGYDDIPNEIPNRDAKKPEDWDDEEDGEWIAPTFPNPEYKGPWKRKKIKNLNYKGKWKAHLIDNPGNAKLGKKKLFTTSS